MRPNVVVMCPPFIDYRPGIVNVVVPVQIQTVLPELGVETLDKGILGRFAWLDKNRSYRLHYIEHTIDSG